MSPLIKLKGWRFGSPRMTSGVQTSTLVDPLDMLSKAILEQSLINVNLIKRISELERTIHKIVDELKKLEEEAER